MKWVGIREKERAVEVFEKTGRREKGTARVMTRAMGEGVGRVRVDLGLCLSL